MNEISVILPAGEEVNLYYPINRHCAIHSYLSDTAFQAGAFYEPPSIGQLEYDAIMLCKTSKDLQLVVDHYLKYHPFGIVFIEGDESIIPNGIQRVRVSHESELTGAGQRLYNIITI